MSLVLLLVCYAGFGWYLSGLKNQPAWMKSSCERVFAPIVHPSAEPQSGEPSNWAFASEPKPTTGETGASETAKPDESSPIRSPTTGQYESDTPKSTIPEPITAEPVETPAPPSESRSPKPYGQPDAAGPTEKSATPAEKPQKERDTTFICSIIVRHNIHAGLLTIGWILVSSLAFISPLTNFSSFISRWFKSDVVAFLTIVTIAGMAAVILYWLHVFLQILTILAADALARIDIQTAGMSGIQAFWLLVLVSLTGLITGWLLNVFLM
jgi:hypothetical protein